MRVTTAALLLISTIIASGNAHAQKPTTRRTDASPVELVPQMGLRYAATAISLSDDGHIVAATSDSGTVVAIWDAGNGLQFRSLRKGGTMHFTDVAVSHDGKTVATACRDYMAGSSDTDTETSDVGVTLWDVASGRRIWHVDAPRALRVAFVPNADRIAVASGTDILFLNSSDGSPAGTITNAQALANDEVRRLAVSGNGKWMATAGFSSDRIAVWDLENQTRSRVISTVDEGAAEKMIELSSTFPDEQDQPSPEGDRSRRNQQLVTSGNITQIAISNDGSWIAATSDPDLHSVTRLWNAGTGQLKRAFTYLNRRDHLSHGWSVAFTADDNLLLSFEGLSAFYDLSGEQIRSLTNFGSMRLACSANGSTIAMRMQRTETPLIRLIDRRSGIPLHDLPSYVFPPSELFTASNGRYMSVGDGNEKSIVWDLAAGRTLPSSGSVGAISADGGMYAAMDSDGVIAVRRMNDGSLVRTFDNPDADYSYPVAFSPNGKLLVATTGFSVDVWNLETGRILGGLAERVEADGIRFSGDGGSLLVQSLGASGATPEEVHAFADPSSNAPRKRRRSGSSGPKYTLEMYRADRNGEARPQPSREDDESSTSDEDDFDGGLIVVDLAKRSVVRHLPPTGGSSDISPDGEMVIAADRWDAVLYSTRSGKEIRRIEVLPHEDGWVPGGFAPRFTADGKSIVESADGHTVREWDVARGSLKRTIATINDALLLATDITPDGKRMFAVGSDGFVYLFGFVDGTEVARFITTNDGEPLIIAPDGYYMASKPALSALAVRSGEHAYPFGQLDIRNNRPDIVLTRLGMAAPSLIAAYNEAYRRRLRRLGFTEQMLSDDHNAPVLEVRRPASAIVDQHELALSITATDNNDRVDRILVEVNGTPAFGGTGIDLRRESSSTIDRTINVPLAVGRNVVQVSAVNGHGAESLRERFEVVRTGPLEQPDLYVVAIGVSKFADARNNLTYAGKDARDVAHRFKQIADAGWRSAHVITITDEQATRDHILAVRDTLARARPGDMVVLFVASHGLIDDSLNYILATSDIDFNAPAARGLRYEELEGLLDGVAAQRKLLLVDACHAGEVDKEKVVPPAAGSPDKTTERVAAARHVTTRSIPRSTRVRNTSGAGGTLELVRELFADLRRGSGAVVIAAAGADEYAYEDATWSNGAFTYALLNGLTDRAADLNRDGSVTANELRDYVAQLVMSLTNGRQRPTARRENLEFDFPITR